MTSWPMPSSSCHLCVLLMAMALLSAQAARVAQGGLGSLSSDPKPPKWADRYIVEFVLSLPQYYLQQPQGLSIPMKAWFDGPNLESRIESFGGVDSVYYIKDMEYDIHPRIDRLICNDFPGSKAGHKTFLPNLNTWSFSGQVAIDGKDANIWRQQYRDGELVSSYMFYTSVEDGTPLKFHMFGVNKMAGAHFDDSYTPLLVTAYSQWSMLHGRGPARDTAEYQQRLTRFQAAHERVASHNAVPDKNYTMHLGRFADWTEEEYYGLMLPEAWRRKQGLPNLKQARKEAVLKRIPDAYDPIAKFKRKMKKGQLPKEVDWRGSGSDPGVKDQGMCGSCWSFGATGTMEGVWYLQTGERRSFSEQQLIDCSFDWGPHACDGGDARPGINFIANSGGIAIEQDYYYHSTVDYCGADNHTRIGQFDGFLEVEARDEVALMEAVFSLGPVSVAMDASLDSFGYYKEGVYYEKDCSNYQLDHQVLLYGYGTSETGQDYWLIKNSWSKLYGNDGFIKIARGHDCGIATEAAVAVVAEASRKPGADSRRLEGVRQW